jgi:putative redox protein
LETKDNGHLPIAGKHVGAEAFVDSICTRRKDWNVASVVLIWAGDRRFDALDGGEMPVDIDGSALRGVRPSDLLPMALAGCSGVDVIDQLGSDRVELFEISVRYTKEPDPPWRFQRFRIHYRAAGHDLTEQELADAVHRSHGEMCSVSHAIRGNVAVETTVEVV